VDHQSWDDAIAAGGDVPEDEREFRPGRFHVEAAEGTNPYPLLEDWNYYWEFEDGPHYKPGLQTVGVDDAQSSFDTSIPKLFLNQATVDQINTDTGPEAPDFEFLAYAVQVEEDRLNREILDKYAEEGALRDDINWAMDAAGIRARDDYLLQKADAQAGRVLKDHEGNWVRAQQYVLKPDDQTVQVLNVCLRGNGSNRGLSTMDFTTRFTTPITGKIQELPWADYLTASDYLIDPPEVTRYVEGLDLSPMELASMSVKFTNPAEESLTESRGFGEKILSDGYWRQEIQNETLAVSSGAVSKTYDFAGSGWSLEPPSDDTYVIQPLAQYQLPTGFQYVFSHEGTLRFVDVVAHAVGDADTVDNTGIQLEHEGFFPDIWRMLATNSAETASYIGSNNLEIVIDKNIIPDPNTDVSTSFFSNPIDVVYIPMSRMLWKGGSWAGNASPLPQ
jgi:hypothetical protein